MFVIHGDDLEGKEQHSLREISLSIGSQNKVSILEIAKKIHDAKMKNPQKFHTKS